MLLLTTSQRSRMLNDGRRHFLSPTIDHRCQARQPHPPHRKRRWLGNLGIEQPERHVFGERPEADRAVIWTLVEQRGEAGHRGVAEDSTHHGVVLEVKYG